MPDPEDSLGGETFSGEEQQDPAEQSLGDGATMGGDTAAHSLGDQSTFGDANVDDELFDDGMKLEDLSERYTEEGVLGKGGMGEVILATDTRLGRKVAIKRILGKAARSKTAVQRFLTEAQSMAELSHPNIVQIYDYGRATDGPFLIMECVPGGSLLEKCKAGPIELDEAVNIFGQLCDGLAKAHAANIIHRDIKPANVLMTGDGIPKLTDFGLAKDDTGDTSMTMEGAVIGTLDFMPPEQRQAAELTDHRSDLWSLAATFYQMLTGKSPKIIRFSDVPTQLQDPLGKALEESKDERFQSALEMKEAVLQAATVGLNASRDLGEGECPSCGTTNPSDRKFCRNTECAASLEADCLSCRTAMPMWEGVCGSCGTKQDALIEEAKEVLQRKHDEAERFLNELKFDDALKAASEIGEQNDLRLQQFAAWHEEFSGRLESSRTSEHTRLGELLQEALAHEQAYDYEAGLQTLTQVAPSLKQTPVTGNEDTADVLTERLTTKQSRLKELETTVRERVSKREITGLLPFVDELLVLKPDRPEVQKLKAQLEKREADLLAAQSAAVKQTEARNQQIISQAQTHIQLLQFDEAIQILGTIAPEYQTFTTTGLSQQANQLSVQRRGLVSDVPVALSNNDYQVAIKNISLYLSEIVKARIQDPQLQQMLDLAQGKASVFRRKKQLVTLGIAAACVVVMLISGVVIKISNDTKAVEIAITNLDWETALELDPDNAEGLRMKSAAEKALKERAARQMAAAEKARAVTAALVKRDWKAVLAIDPNNVDGLRIKASEEKATAVTAAIAKGDWKTVLALSPENSEVLRIKATEEKAIAVTAALAKGDWNTALALDPNNSEGLEMAAAAADKDAMEKAAAEIQARIPTTYPIGMALIGREKEMKRELLASYGGTETTESAVIRGLEWLKRNQQRDGMWSLTGNYTLGGPTENRAAATAMALLAFQGHGSTHKSGPYQSVVARGWNGLIKKQDAEGNFFSTGGHHHRLYTHAQATIALCELYGMTKDETLKAPAEKALSYCFASQSPQGGWRYAPGGASDTSVTGWFVMALQTGRMAGLTVPDVNLNRISGYLDTATTDDGTRYAYMPGQSDTLSMTAEGLLCRQYLGWKQSDPRLVRGLDYLGDNPISFADMDVYYWYYCTQAMHHMGGEHWAKWNSVMRRSIPAEQLKTGNESGSWGPDLDRHGHLGGRLYSTCLCIYMLEAYYRHLPIYQHSKKDQLSPEFQGKLEYERALVLIQSARLIGNGDERDKQFAIAQQFLEKIAQESQDAELKILASNQLGNLLFQRANLILFEANQDENKAVRDDLLGQARTLLQRAREIYVALGTQLNTELDVIPETLDPKTQQPQIDRRQSLYGNYLQVLITATKLLEEIGKTYDPGTAEHTSAFEKALPEYDEIAIKYRNKGAGLIALIGQGRCYLAIDDTKRSMSYLKQVVDQRETPGFRNIVTLAMPLYIETLSHESVNQIKQALAIGVEWNADIRPNETSNIEWHAFQLELARTYIKKAQALEKKNPEDPESRKAYVAARKLTQEVLKYPGQYKSVARDLIASLNFLE